MNSMKVLLLLIIVAALSVAILTETPSLFSGQHTFINISSDRNDISCISCHPQIADELAKSQIHSNFACEECHRIKQTAYGVTITYAERKSASRTIGKEAHAAYVPRCLDCHGNNGVYVNYEGVTKTAPVAKGFNSTPIPDYVAHKSFVEWANKSGIAVGENEACLACHTNFSMKMTYRYFYNISFTKDANWNILNFNVNGTRTYSVFLDKTGDQGKHEWRAVSLTSQDNYNQSFCIKCHKNIYDALVNGTPSSPYNHYTHAPIEIDSDDHGGNTNSFTGVCYTGGGMGGMGGGMGKDHDWRVNNYWGHKRYHYVPQSYRASWVNTTYCLECHNVEKFRIVNPSGDATYNLQSVVLETNSSYTHAAEKLTCTSCHGIGRVKEPVDICPTGHASFIAQVGNYTAALSGDTCMSCHEAASHNVNNGAYESGQCGMCHGDYWSTCGACHSGYTLSVDIESEPSGNATWQTQSDRWS